MIQKATWIIPGILVTLLLGLLWAMPAFAADAGEISFFNGDDEIGFVSLNGFAAGDGFMVQIEDQDLNAPTEFTGANAVTATDDMLYDWTVLADRDGDGVVNYNDFTAFNHGEDRLPGTADDIAVEVARANLTLDVTNGKLTWDGSTELIDGTNVVATHLEFHLNRQLTISAFVSEHEQAETEGDIYQVDSVNVVNSVEFMVAENPQDTNLVGTAWTDVLADPDGDGNLVEHITATREIMYSVLDTTQDPVVLNPTQKTVMVDLDVAIDENEDGDARAIRVTGVSVNPTDDAVTGTPPTLNAEPIVVDVVGSTPITLTYPTVYMGMGSLSQIGLVTVESGGGVRTSVALRETSAVSGKFQATVQICDSDDTDPLVTPNVPICEIGQTGQETDATEQPGMVTFPVDAAGDSVAVRYSDASPRNTKTANVSLDNGVPAFSEIAPASGTAGKDTEPDVTFNVVDAESGISGDDESTGFEQSIRIVAGLFEADSDSMNLINGPIILTRTDDLTVDEITDGFSAEARLREGTDTTDPETDRDELDAGANDEYEIRWWAVAVDSAGNTGVSDSDTDTECSYSGKTLTDSEGDSLFSGSELVTALMAAKNTDDDPATIEESCDPNVIRVDSAAPGLVEAITGVFPDADEDSGEGNGSLTSIVARFDEALDCDSVSADDFEVDGTAPNSVTCKGKNVYLSVDEMDSNDTPNVEVAEEAIADRAGNTIGADAEQEAEDGIPAGLTVTIAGTAEGTRVVTKGEVTITITSDERLKGRPDVAIQRVEDDYDLGDDKGNSAAPTGNTDEWSITRTLDDAGLYNVYVTAEDRVNSGESKAGVETFDSETIKKGKAFLFEVDNDVTEPKFTPESDGSTDNAGIFIRADFNNEGNEYGLAEAVEVEITAAVEDKESTTDVDESKDAVTEDQEKVTTTAADVDTDFDTHSTVTLVSATFNDEDVTDNVITRDNILYVYRPGNLENGEHTFEIEVEDNAGTEETFSTTFTKIDKPDYKLDINPGPNLVSFPADPANGDINAVFGGEGNEDITTVLTYDNNSGLWLTATKGADGMFMGDLTTINGMNGYWVVADGIVDLSVLLEGSGDFTSPPPHIAVSEGWNLIGVVDTDQSDAKTLISDYFANIMAEVVYGFDSFESKLVRQAAGDDVMTGRGYWVFANEAGIIIP